MLDVRNNNITSLEGISLKTLNNANLTIDLRGNPLSGETIQDITNQRYKAIILHDWPHN